MTEYKISIGFCYNDMLNCSRCKKYTNDVGKIKQWPDLCMRCADVIENMIQKNVDPTGHNKDWADWIAEHESKHENNPLRAMNTTMVIERGNGNNWEMVYMPEDVFKTMYAGRLGNPSDRKNKK